MKNYTRKLTCRRGSVYMVVLGMGLIVSMIGLSAVTLAHINARTIKSSNDWVEAGQLATAAVELAMTEISADPNWRTWCTSGGVGCHQSMGRGTLTWKPVDADGNLGDDSSDPVRIYGIGQVGSVRRTYSVELSSAAEDPMDVLSTVAHTGKNMTVSSGASITLSGGPLSGSGTIQNSGTITGATEGPNTPTGNAPTAGHTTKAAKALPETVSDVYADYLSRATSISWGSINSGTIQNCVLSAGNNPFGGGTNSNGIYAITVPASTGFTIKNCRIRGTLVVYLSQGSWMIIQNEVLWESHSSTLPILMTKAGGTGTSISFCSTGGTLSETTLATNFNPSHTPYNGSSDSANDDTYTSQLSGLVHITTGAQATHVTNSNITNMSGGFKMTGTIITCGMLTVSGTGHSLTFSQSLYDNPPDGYTSAGGGGTIAPTAGSWRWDSAP